MPYISNPSIPALPASTQTEVKVAIQNLTNWINTFNKSLGDSLGTVNTDGSLNYYSSSLPFFLEKSMTGEKVIANIIKSLEGKITESQLNKDLNERINLIDDPNTGLIAKLEQEVTDRTNAILAEQEARIEDILNEVEDRNAAILVETNARIDSDESLASQITTLVSTYDDLAAVVDTEIETRVAADIAEASSRETLATQIRGSYTGTNLASLSSGLLYSEREARTTADSSEVSARQLLSSKVIGTTDPTGVTLGTLTSGLIYDEKTARSTADSAEVTARQSLTATLSGYNDITGKTLADISTGIIAEEKTARVTADSANATSISTLSSQVNNATTGLPAAHSAINQINTVSSTSTSTNAKALFSVKSAVEDASTGLATKASVTQLNTAITTLDTALSQDISQVSTTVAGNTASIETLSESIDGVKAEYTIKLNTNNKIAGIGLIAEEGSPTAFEVLADEFAIVNSDGVTSTVPFIVTGGNTYIKNALIADAAIDTAKISDLSVNTLKLTDGAVSIVSGISIVDGTTYEDYFYNMNGWTKTYDITIHNNTISTINNIYKKVLIFMNIDSINIYPHFPVYDTTFILRVSADIYDGTSTLDTIFSIDYPNSTGGLEGWYPLTVTLNKNKIYMFDNTSTKTYSLRLKVEVLGYSGANTDTIHVTTKVYGLKASIMGVAK